MPRLAEVGGGARLFCERGGGAATGDDRTEDRRPSGFPEVGGGFLGFRLIDEVGRGAFGRVYLATQGDLADRPVVLKVTAERYDERRRSPGSSTRNRAGLFEAPGGSVPGGLHAVPGHDHPPRRHPGPEAARALPETGEGLWGTTAGRRGGAGVREIGARPGRDDGGPPRTGKAASIFRPAGPTLDAAAWADPSRAPGRLSYVEAVLWVAARLADGLAHAHERGIVHAISSRPTSC